MKLVRKIIMRKSNSLGIFCFLAASTSLAAIVSGCAKGSETNDFCASGSTVACTCSDGQNGVSQCLDGMYTICQCGVAGATTRGAPITSTVSSAAGGSVATSSGASGTAAKGGAGTGGGVGGKCPNGYTCSSNPWMALYVQNLNFCAETAATTDTANALPPACTDTAECKSKGLSSAVCEDFSKASNGKSDLLGLSKGCLWLCKQ